MTSNIQDIVLTFPEPSKQNTSFKYSFSVMPSEERLALNKIHNFCRYADDIVDEAPVLSSSTKLDEVLIKRKLLGMLREEVDKCYLGTTIHPVLKPLIEIVVRFRIPKQYFMILIDGVEMDLKRNRYENFSELKDYCFGVASIVGLMCLEIFGYKYEETKEYAINLGIALQLTNIIRDVAIDAKLGRIYIPKEDLTLYDYSEKDLFSGLYNVKFVELMRFQARRAREYYGKARAALHSDERNSVFAAEIMDAIYYRLLEKIELREFNVFTNNRISVRTSHKIWIAAKLWIVTKLLTNRKTLKS
ncbi:MAG: squalene/phytoene synthase family protein [Chlorobiota bacterium]|nr:MAG: squalene/phytoene synthase family protein [Chlorobiota bacterium]